MTERQSALLIVLMAVCITLVIIPAHEIVKRIRYLFFRLCQAWCNWDPYYTYTPIVIRTIRRIQHVLGLG